MDETHGPDDPRNQPADQKLINQHPELIDPSTRGKVHGPGAPPQPTAPQPETPTPGQGASERPPIAATPGPPSTANSDRTDSQGHPRPHGPGGSDEEKQGVGAARRQERERGGRRG